MNFKIFFVARQGAGMIRYALRRPAGERGQCMEEQKIINFVGRSGSGKTALIEELISYYRGKGNRVAVMKSLQHEFEMDYPGKDTYRYTDAGANASAITNGDRFAVIGDVTEGISPLDTAKKYLADYDILIIEGYKENPMPKIEVVGKSFEKPLFQSGIMNIRFVISDDEIETDLPLYKKSDFKGIVKAIEDLIFEG